MVGGPNNNLGEGALGGYNPNTIQSSQSDGLTWMTFSDTLGGEENPLILVAGLGEEAPCISLGRHSEI